MPAHRRVAARLTPFVLAVLFLLPLPRAVAGEARFAPPHEDMGVDWDGDGRFDSLRIVVNVLVSTPNVFTIELRLFDGQNVSELGYRYGYRLLAGAMGVTFDFGGVDLWGSGVDGPYVANIWLRDEAFRQLDFSQYITRAYLHTDFEQPEIRLVPPHTDAGNDTDGDGLFDFLQYRVNVDVQDPGSFRIEGQVRVGQYNTVAWDSVVLTLPPGPNTVSLSFPGWRVRSAGNGPYAVVIWAYSDFVYLQDHASYTTGPYTSAQFDTASAAFAPPHADQGVDADGDGFYDVLRFTANVSIEMPGRYWVDAELFDSGGRWIWDASSNQVELSPGFHTLPVDFEGDRIRRSAQDGAFRVDLSLRIDYGPVPAATGVHVTAPYTITEFVPALLLFSGAPRDRGVDTDANGLFDGLAVNGSLAVAKSGFYRIGGVLRTFYGSDLDFEMVGRWMNPGPTSFELLFDGGKIRGSSADGPYRVYLYLLGSGDTGLGETSFDTQTYLSSDFEPPPIAYAPPHGSTPIDTDGDSLFDVLRIAVNVTVAREGTYSVSGNLYPSNGTGYAFAAASATLSPGARTINLDFPGPELREMGTVGEHSIALNLFAGPVFVGWDFLSTNLNASEFETGIIRFQPPHHDAAIDRDGDRALDTLRVDVRIEVDVAGMYLIDAYAIDSALRGVGDSSAFYELPGGASTVSLDFPGWRLRGAVDGPFLIEVYVYDADGQELAEDEHITGPYRIADFAQRAVEFTPPHAEAVVDTDGDGLHDRLAVALSVFVSVAGTYSLFAYLTAPNVWGSFGSLHQDVFLAPGAQTAHVEFSTGGLALSSVSGPYEVTAYLDGSSTTHITAPYSKDSFDVPELRFEFPFADAAEDRDVPPDGLPDVLRIDLRINASDAGNVLVYAGLWDWMESVPIDSQERWASLDAGVNVVPISFSGALLRASGIDGPYVVRLAALGDGYARRPYVEAEHRSSAYRAEDFELFAPSVLQGVVRVSGSRDGVFYPDVSAYNYEDGIFVKGFSDAFGVYDVGLYEGDWFVAVDDGYHFPGRSSYQSEATFVRVRGSVTTYDFDIMPSTNAPSVVDLSFQGWNQVDFQRAEEGTTDNRTARQRIEWEYGNRDGFLTLEEFGISNAGFPPARTPSQSHELFRVDDLAYELAPGSESFRLLGVEAPVSDPTPIRSELASSFTPTAPVTPAIRHEIAVRVDYDAMGVDRVYRVSLPAGWELLSYSATSLVRVNVTGRVVLLDPGPDVPIWRDIYLPPVLHHEWVRLAVATPDLAPPTILSASATPDPVEVGEPLTISASVVDDIAVHAVAVEVVAPTGVPLGNFTMGASGADYAATLSPTQPGGYVFRIWAFDSVGRVASWEGRFSAVDTKPPVILDARPTPDPAEVGLPVTISVLVSDALGVALVFVQIRDPTDGVVGTFVMADAGGRYAHAFTPADLGLYTLRFTATDLAGNSATATGSFAAVDTTAPIALAGPDGSVGVGTEVTFDGTASMDNDAIASFTWNFTDGGNPVIRTGAIVTYAFTSAGTYVVTLTVVDPSANRDSDTVVLNVVRPAGAIRGIVSGSSGPIAGATVRLFEGSTERRTTATDPNGVFELSDVSPGSYTIRVEARSYVAAAIVITVVAGQTAYVAMSLGPSVGEGPGIPLLPIAVAAMAAAAVLGLLLTRRRKPPSTKPKGFEEAPGTVAKEEPEDSLPEAE